MELISSKGNCKSCYLDGGFFAKILKENNQIASASPIIMKINHSEDGVIKDFEIRGSSDPLILGRINYYRVVLESPVIRHSMLLIVNPDNWKCMWWNPRKTAGVVSRREGTEKPSLRKDHPTDFGKRMHAQVKTILYDYIKKSAGPFSIEEITTEVPHVIRDNCGGKYGYCTAYVLKMALCNSLGVKFDTSNITGFVKAIEEKYEPIESDDIEYDFSPMGAVAGGLGGAAIGGLVGGAGGLAAGGLIGGLAGGSLFSKNDLHKSNWLPRYNTTSYSHYDKY